MFVETSDQRNQQAIVARAAAMPPAVFKALFSNMFAWDAAELTVVLKQIKVPLTVWQSTTVNEKRERRSMLAGETSTYLDTITNCVPQAEVSVIPGIGHFIQQEATDAVSQAVIQHL